MSAQKKQNKYSALNASIKTLIATASVAATLVGWALLPANDPAASAGAAVGAGAGTQPQTSMSVPGDLFQAPGNNDSQSAPFEPSAPNFNNLPQVQVPQGFSGRPRAFTNSHSSR